MTNHDLATGYFTAWQAKDFTTLRSLLADSVTFRGPLGRADDVDACIAGLTGMAQIMTDLQIRAMVAEGDDVITFFDLHTSLAAPAPTANWMHVEHGRIAAVNVTFDARELAAAMGR